MKALLLSLLLIPITLCGQIATERGVIASRSTLSVGTTSLYDSYLSPLSYSGAGFAAMYRRSSILSFLPDRYNLLQTLRLDYSSALNTPRTSGELYALISYRIGMDYGIIRQPNLHLRAGMEANLFAGGIYNMKGGNNPGSAQVGLDLNPMIKAEYTFNLWQQHFILSSRASTPLIGTYFAPRFLEPYYEIFLLGDYLRNFKLAHPGSLIGLDVDLSLGWNIRKWQIALGWNYFYRCTQAWENRVAIQSNYFTVGFSRCFSYQNFK